MSTFHLRKRNLAQCLPNSGRILKLSTVIYIFDSFPAICGNIFFARNDTFLVAEERNGRTSD